MGFLDIVLSILPNVPFLPPAAPTDAKKGRKQQPGPSNRFLGKPPQQNEADKKPASEQQDAEK
ncbi:hypothetical protein BFJ63_vAg1940 [Fusarium oxysporum f. sp. narcissi]|uniref:Uncharacterized protein n=3 Tax=Fusarium oxysporum TaxID=5507 RepID=A0A420NTI0_FUSOX|nr:hypothetical protein H9L39_05478 [Fusarium oxysporum f. sp. albedinis]RKK24404.1 hypothetical protein BFJ65_g2345 [Fusarium oxysporum f. sp. cepae]RKK83601.1 hypothetical protein BFJ71_g14850 [Fusarium oxysporum]RYC95258.1 hypothetical protein BFJ63_vAg1940 [Fusarium oxysporum f. sp. narcissi]RKK59186.1 hypothetical protein BFJ67_g2716 [Fusarium oxysporum f. sp. cepae]